MRCTVWVYYKNETLAHMAYTCMLRCMNNICTGTWHRQCATIILQDDMPLVPFVEILPETKLIDVIAYYD